MIDTYMANFKLWLEANSQRRYLSAGADRYSLDVNLVPANKSYGRIVCSVTNPHFEKAGMPMYQTARSELKNYFGVHVGSHDWLGILRRDGYCKSGDAYLYTIHAYAMIRDGIEIYVMDDFNATGRDDSTPDSELLYSHVNLINAKYISLDKVIPRKDIPETPLPYDSPDEDYPLDDE